MSKKPNLKPVVWCIDTGDISRWFSTIYCKPNHKAVWSKVKQSVLVSHPKPLYSKPNKVEKIKSKIKTMRDWHNFYCQMQAIVAVELQQWLEAALESVNKFYRKEAKAHFETLSQEQIAKFTSLYVANTSPGLMNNFAKSADIKNKQFVHISEIDKTLDKVLIMRNLHHWAHLKQRREHGAGFVYIDAGYTNWATHGKVWHRICVNDIHATNFVERSSDRWDALKIELQPWKTTGQSIIVSPPTPAICGLYGINETAWTEKIVNAIKRQTSRNVIVRYKPNKKLRVPNAFGEFLVETDAYCVVTWSSIAAVESICMGIPAINLGPSVCNSLSCGSVKNINSLIYPDRTLWANHIAYSQFNEEEIANGYAWNLLYDQIAKLR